MSNPPILVVYSDDKSPCTYLAEAGAPPGFARAADACQTAVAAICHAAAADGVFGVPSFVLDGEIFWGREHLPEIRDRLAG